MKKLSITIIFLFLVQSFIGCGRSQYEVMGRRLKHISGIRKEKVLSILGNPVKEDKYGNVEFLFYETGGSGLDAQGNYVSLLPILLKDSIVVKWGFDCYQDLGKYKGIPEDTTNIMKWSMFCGVNVTRSVVSSDDFGSSNMRFTKPSNRSEDGLIILPMIKAGYGYEISMGSKWVQVKNKAALTLELSYLNTKHKADFMDEPFNVTYQGIDLNGRMYVRFSKFGLCFSLGIPLYSSLTVEQGSYRIVNYQPTDSGDVTYYGGFVTFPYGWPTNISIGIGATYNITENLSMELMYTRRAVRYYFFSGIIGERNIQEKLTSVLGVNIYENSSVYTTYSSFQLGLKYSFNLF